MAISIGFLKDAVNTFDADQNKSFEQNASVKLISNVIVTNIQVLYHHNRDASNRRELLRLLGRADVNDQLVREGLRNESLCGRVLEHDQQRLHHHAVAGVPAAAAQRRRLPIQDALPALHARHHQRRLRRLALSRHAQVRDAAARRAADAGEGAAVDLLPGQVNIR